MADESGLSSLTADSLAEPLPEQFPEWFRIGSPKYAYEYHWQYGKVWRCIRKADGHPTTGPSDKLFLIKIVVPGTEGFHWLAVHAPEDADAATLLANNRVVFGSSEDVLAAGDHTWSWYTEENQWQQLGQFETAFLS